jgi:hypothetical protein
MAPTDERTTKPDQLINAQNENPGFVVQIPEGLSRQLPNNIQFHPLIVLRNLIQKALHHRIESVDYVFRCSGFVTKEAANNSERDYSLKPPLKLDKHVSMHPARLNISLLAVNPAPLPGGCLTYRVEMLQRKSQCLC